ncbi:hypothetical protein DTL21_06685 [Bremerella cremea]|uniref:Uncharacterized protein n=1 Tax=Blastopirellula marina TaxID=124 RepID=A0A2S8FZL6_9BACT|nr:MULTISPECIES: hypothetical protein [Pirellulaceae]PQO37626.1 hypothetical protein C5Y83_06685 [Blastopirellula marina]RCS50013.1 hypothetical protein DTL21_06685 [Bremerella cremea]
MPDSYLLAREKSTVIATNQEAFEYLYDRWGLVSVQVMISAVAAYGADTGSVQVLTLLTGTSETVSHEEEKALVRAMHYVEENLSAWQEQRVIAMPDGQTLTIDAALVAED